MKNTLLILGIITLIVSMCGETDEVSNLALIYEVLIHIFGGLLGAGLIYLSSKIKGNDKVTEN